MTNPSVLQRDFRAERSKLLTMPEVAARLGISRPMLSHIQHGRVKHLEPILCIRIGRRTLFLESTVVEWILRNQR